MIRRLRTLSRRTAGLLFTTIGLCIAPGCADQAFFWPDGTSHQPAEELVARSRDVWFEAADGTVLHGLWLFADGPSRGTVVYCHGNNRNLTWHANSSAMIRDLGVDLLLFDPRGFGRSEGEADREGFLVDCVAAVDLALARDPDRVVVFGRSLGAAGALFAATERPRVRGVIAESAFASWEGVASRATGPFGGLATLLVTDGPDPVDLAGRLQGVPLEVLHGREDRLVPIDDALEIFESASVPRHLTVFDGVGHRSAARVRTEDFLTAVDAALHRIFTIDRS